MSLLTIRPLIDHTTATLTLASVILTPEGSLPDLQMDPSYDLFLPFDTSFGVLREIELFSGIPIIGSFRISK